MGQSGIEESITKSMEEVLEMQNGNIPKKSWRRDFNDLRKELLIIQPKVENGQVILDKNDPHHRYLYTEGDL